MKALILNSGKGNRMGALTEHKPKCLVEIGEGRTLLSGQIEILKNSGINSFIITTGPFAGMIEEYLGERFPGLEFEYIYNPKYSATNYIYSVFLAQEHLQEDIFLLHGDLVTEQEVCDKLLKTPDENAVVVYADVPLPEKDFKASLNNNVITQISVSIFDEDCVSLLPFYKLSKKAVKIWLEEIAVFIGKGITNVYAEEAFNKRSKEIGLKPVYMEDQLCMEIDTLEDLELAIERLKKRR